MMNIELDPSQIRARDMVLSAGGGIGVITGGPGTGKTTTLRAILDGLDEQGRSYQLASPTGKAAKRMTEATGREAKTVHRLLKFNPQVGGGFEHGPEFPVEADVVVIDESSMLDIELAAALSSAVDNDSYLLLVGDVDQLPPVGPGAPFWSAIECGKIPVARLSVVHRSAQESWVCANAPRILAGEDVELATRPDFMFVEVESSAQVPDELCKLVGDVDQILTPQRSTSGGVNNSNRVMQDHSNPAREGVYQLKCGEIIYRVGDPVIQGRNDYQLNVVNGEVGTVTGPALSDEGKPIGGVRVKFDGRTVHYDAPNASRSLSLAYAITVHKSQGSEWPAVAVVCHSSMHFMLSRNLLYTAVTRAKKRVVIVGDHAGIERAISNLERKRNTDLANQMQGEAA